jgi:ABC-type sugar transport system substrate-binding protein
MNFLVSLTMAENAYQQDQAAAADEAARRLGAQAQILYAENDAITQSQQLLNVIQSSSAHFRPDAIVCHPVGTTLKQVAREAMVRGIGWALLNREDDYLTELRNTDKPAFCVTVDQGRCRANSGAAVRCVAAKGWSHLVHSRSLNQSCF